MPFPPRGPPEAPLSSPVSCQVEPPTHQKNVTSYAAPLKVQSATSFVSSCDAVSGPDRRVTVKHEDASDDLRAKVDDGSSSPVSESKQKSKAEKTKTEKDQTRNPFLVILTAEQARSIYSLRSPATAEGPAAHLVAGKSSLVAEMYGVSPKTIRDVWNRKTWTQVAATNVS
jgi:hypothetical protein